ncbi:MULTISPECIES: NAD(P)/FAD-dependent oxidoreductase [unclassified Granulicatella]|uniref:NAD(P)/FAD-dependent oxidoreductase n=1 Tax=unclassified Granulicatella TaxID=2630493 RepID=UPI0010731277|nr:MULTISPECIES: NAD(P)/FAD-dependent oxidoreductase [unclassified Granulicatella]MBF0781002.1 NAD(P)/FAD-dependent oxidoreductase [Granulicatella sp. 19428wC4_WM01]TFU92718.1 NAD(P)/FAD-dependent oxidoreductase [Granulicatella sp. WM01]
MYDVIIIGGGTSGLMASISAAKHNAKVLLIEKNAELGKKLLLTGGGRCNVTNNRPSDEVIKHIPGNGKFLYSAFSQFDNYNIMSFFQHHGVALKEEDHGRMFPITDRSQTIRDTFIDLIKRYGVTVKTKATVTQIEHEQNKILGITLSSGEFIAGKSIIIATGGKSIPRTGSTGDGYIFAKQMGHTITPLFPTEVPLTSNEPFIQEKTLQGLSLREIALSVVNQKKKVIITHRMDMIFTHFGVSGPAVLRCSSFVHKELSKYPMSDVTLKLDCLPDYSTPQLTQQLIQTQKNDPQKEIKTVLKQYIPERLVLFFLKKQAILPNTALKQLNISDFENLAYLLKEWTFTVNGSLPLEKSFVTGGGIHLKEINPKTMESKIVPHLFFCGEILDIHGYTGGYNITAAFVTGYIAGKHAAQLKSEIYTSL